jgi:hypothetical protein
MAEQYYCISCCKERQLVTINPVGGITYPQNSSTLSKLMTRFISSIHPNAAPGVCATGVCGNAVDGVWGKFRPLVAGESNQSVHGE